MLLMRISCNLLLETSKTKLDSIRESLYFMSIGILRVRASVHFLTPEEGRRTSSVRGLYRPIHNFGDADNRELWFGQIPLSGNDMIEPGDSRDLIVEFPLDPRLVAELVPGRGWRIQEGPTLVANARLIEVLDGT